MPPIPDGDVFVHAGDLMYEGTPAEWQSRIDWLASLPHKVKLIVPGNHDFYTQHYEGLARSQLRKQAGFKMVTLEDGLIKLPNGMTMLGIQWVTGLPGWAWSKDDEWLEDKLTKAAYRPHIVVSHAPVYGVVDKLYPHKHGYAQESVGTIAFANWLRQTPVFARPEHWFCGHIHESYGSDSLYGVQFHNVAMCDRRYEQVNPPIVVDV